MWLAGLSTGETMDFDKSAAAPDDFGFTFHGSYTRAVDAKGRFALPFRFRQGGAGPAEEKYVVARGADGSLSLLPYSVWIANFNRMRQGKPGPALRANLRRMSRNSLVLEPDSQGRVAVSPDFLADCGITKKIAVVGMGSYMELWDPDVLAKQDEGGAEVDAGFMDDFYR
jgi:MraZ protein